jgi:hypothetical protein
MDYARRQNVQRASLSRVSLQLLLVLSVQYSFRLYDAVITLVKWLDVMMSTPRDSESK